MNDDTRLTALIARTMERRFYDRDEKLSDDLYIIPTSQWLDLMNDIAGDLFDIIRRRQSDAYDHGYNDGIRWATGKADHTYANQYTKMAKGAEGQ